MIMQGMCINSLIDLVEIYYYFIIRLFWQRLRQGIKMPYKFYTCNYID